MREGEREATVGGGGRTVDRPAGRHDVVGRQLVGDRGNLGDQLGIGHELHRDGPRAVGIDVHVDVHVDPARCERDHAHTQSQDPTNHGRHYDGPPAATRGSRRDTATTARTRKFGAVIALGAIRAPNFGIESWRC